MSNYTFSIKDTCDNMMRSLVLQPGTLEELSARDFLKEFDEYRVWGFLNSSYCKKDWYEENGVLHVYARYHKHYSTSE